MNDSIYNNVTFFRLKSVDSTNNEAKRLLQTGITTPFVITSKEQTNGRGRLSRSFYSPADTGLYMSYTTNVPDTTNAVSITTRVAVAVAKCIEELTGNRVTIKWVNDIYLDNKKVCGILTEGVLNYETGNLSAAIIGIGINLTTSQFPADISNTAGSLGLDTDKDNLISSIIREIDLYLKKDSNEFISEYKSRSNVLGKEISYTDGAVTKYATAIDIDCNGGLVINKKNGEITTLSTGEITVRTL